MSMTPDERLAALDRLDGHLKNAAIIVHELEVSDALETQLWRLAESVEAEIAKVDI